MSAQQCVCPEGVCLGGGIWPEVVHLPDLEAKNPPIACWDANSPPIAGWDTHTPAYCMLGYTLPYEQNNRMTFRCKNITFPQLHLWVINMWWILNTWVWLAQQGRHQMLSTTKNIAFILLDEDYVKIFNSSCLLFSYIKLPGKMWKMFGIQARL